MSDIAIRVDHLGKQYRLGGQQAAYSTFREALVNSAKNSWQWLKGERNADLNTFWALDDVSFEVKHGEAIGIIGRNGAGKSTLLKILSRITSPTRGRVDIYGRVGSLLEVGTGFHPELSGRENIYLNGAILGMSRVEIARKFDEIVDFSGVERFLDTPVKHYSSGMFVRLAFAVAAHLEPEILVVDEVLAVGDAEFQKKCLGKMGNVAQEGRTVLFVSHNMAAIRNLCPVTIWINKGKLETQGTTQTVVDHYLKKSSLVSSDNKNLEEIIEELPPDPVFKFQRIEVRQDEHPVNLVVLSGNGLDISIKYKVILKTTGLRIYVDLLDDEMNLIFRSFHDNDKEGIPVMKPGVYISRVTIPPDTLAPRDYYIKINATIHNERSILPSGGIHVPINVTHTGNYNKAYPSDTIRGALAPVLSWTTKIEE